jgi:hypothetical protein
VKLVFCSCSKIQSVSEQPSWIRIQAERPDALLLLGDTVYLDHDQHVDAAKLGEDLRNNHRLQHAEPNFAALRRRTVAMAGEPGCRGERIEIHRDCVEHYLSQLCG